MPERKIQLFRRKQDSGNQTLNFDLYQDGQFIGSYSAADSVAYCKHFTESLLSDKKADQFEIELRKV